MMLDYKAIGNRIKPARIKADMKQEDLADQVDISTAHMSNIKTGKTHVSLTAIIHIANTLVVTVDELLCDNVVKTKVQFEKDIVEHLEDCDDYEIRIIRDIRAAIKPSLDGMAAFFRFTVL